MATRPTRYAALLSGGLDSAVALKLAAASGHVAACLFFDYGQKALARECRAARTMAAALRAKFEIIDIRWLGKIARSALVDKSRPLPHVKRSCLADRRTAARTARAVWVPNRNAVMLSLAAAYAEAARCDAVVAGFNREEGATFPDNSKPFVRAMNEALRVATSGKVALYCPLIDMDKAQIVRTGIRIGAPLDAIWSCYAGGRRFCWKCESCARLERALTENKRLDWFKRINPHAGGGARASGVRPFPSLRSSSASDPLTTHAGK
jgi:7-cyano-7-deazaguanine synthase